jgi:hypothetical protein
MQRYLRRKFLNAAVCMENGMTLVAVYVSSGSMSSVTGSAEYTDDIDFPVPEYRRPVAKLQSRASDLGSCLFG